MKRCPRAACAGALLLALLGSPAALAEKPGGLARLDTFLQRHKAHQAIRGLSQAEKVKLDRTLAVRERTIPDRLIGKLLNNPVAWRPGPQGRQLLRSVIDALPDVATVPGADKALKSACSPNVGNFRGFGFEIVASAALKRYREPNGCNPRIVRMSADIRGSDGRKRESDGCCMFDGADRRQRLVTMKSVASTRALKRAIKKGTSQLALRNGSQAGVPRDKIKPGVFMLGYHDPAVLSQARRKDWTAAANRSGAKLLVLAVNQLDGRVTRLASVAPAARPKRHKVRLRPSNGPTFRQREQRRQVRRRQRSKRGGFGRGAGAPTHARAR